MNKIQNNKEDISLKINDTIIQDYQAIVDKFNDYFANMAQHTVDSLSICYGSIQKNYQDFFMKQLKQILNLKKLPKRQYWVYYKNKNTKGHDQISNKLLKCGKKLNSKTFDFHN